MYQYSTTSLAERVRGWDETWSLAVVFGLASIPWTYAFVAGLEIPLWPSFIASATFYAAGGGLTGLKQGYASNLAGIAYAAATLWIVDALGGGVVALSVVVGAFMFLASLHGFVKLLSFTPGASSATRRCSASTPPARPPLVSPASPARRSPPSYRCCSVRSSGSRPSG